MISESLDDDSLKKDVTPLPVASTKEDVQDNSSWAPMTGEDQVKATCNNCGSSSYIRSIEGRQGRLVQQLRPINYHSHIEAGRV